MQLANWLIPSFILQPALAVQESESMGWPRRHYGEKEEMGFHLSSSNLYLSGFTCHCVEVRYIAVH